ncbi:MAG: hypothetical protein WCD18_28090 [Thermosynechococcaceae cyanobacterium]
MGFFSRCNVATFVATLKIIEINSNPLRLMLLNVKKWGNSLSIIVPKEMAVSMSIDDGDQIFATKTPTGHEISAYDPDFAQKIEAARRGMRKYRNALVELAI